MLARRAAPKVFARHQDRSRGIARRIEHKLAGLFSEVFSIPYKAPVIKQKLPTAGALNPLQELLRNNLISVHIHFVERNNDAGVSTKCLHAIKLLPPVE